MNQLDDDLKTLNIQFLMLARDCAKKTPMEAIWKFNLTNDEVNEISTLSLDEIQSLSECGRVLFRPPVMHPQPGVTPSITAALLSSPMVTSA